MKKILFLLLFSLITIFIYSQDKKLVVNPLLPLGLDETVTTDGLVDTTVFNIDNLILDANPDSIITKEDGVLAYSVPATGISMSNQGVADSLTLDAVFDSLLFAGAIVGDADVVAGLKTWEHTGTAADTITISGVKTYDMYLITFASDPGAPADWWYEAKVDSVIIHTGANVTDTPSYAWFRFRKY